MMIIKEVRVQNFRCIKDQTVRFDRMTIFIGPNGAGKSAFLKAMELFFEANANYDIQDFYGEDHELAITVRISFSALSDIEKIAFQKYVQGDTLLVKKIMRWPCSKGNQTYHGVCNRNPDFEAFRNASGTGLRSAYNELKNGSYSSFPAYTNKTAAADVMDEWETNNPDSCIPVEEEAQFYGFSEVGASDIDDHVKFIVVPAVREAARLATEGRGTPMREIMEIAVKSALRERNDLESLRKDAQLRYSLIMDSAKQNELQELSEDIDDILKALIPTSGVEIEWKSTDQVQVPLPDASVRLKEDDFSSHVEACGHGLQRAFIMSLLQYLAVIQSRNKRNTEDPKIGNIMPSFVLAIEEPELYQHPNRQRHMSKVLQDLSMTGIDGVLEDVQVIYTTHSPLFVNIHNFNNIRCFRKIHPNTEFPKETSVLFTEMETICRILEDAQEMDEGAFTSETLLPRLKTLMTPWMNEGFFAKAVVLVEGEGDRAMILAFANHLGYDLEALDISVIPCHGKTNLDRPAAIFSQLDIPTYVIWDSDFGSDEKSKKTNHSLLRQLDATIEDWPDRVTNRYACFRTDMTDKIRNEIGADVFEKELSKSYMGFGYEKKSDGMKNPFVLRNMIIQAEKQGAVSTTLVRIAKKIVKLLSP